MAVIHQGQGSLDLFWAGGFLPDAEEAPLGQQRRDRNIQRPVTGPTNVQRFPKHRGRAFSYPNTVLPRLSIQSANVALWAVQTHVAVDLLNCSKSGLDGLSRSFREPMERLTFNRRAHHWQRPKKAGR